MLIVAETHPVQYHAPIYRFLQQQLNIPVTAIYGSDFSIAGYFDQHFRTKFAWDSDLLSGYRQIFLSHAANNQLSAADHVRAAGLKQTLHSLKPTALLLPGYSPSFYRSVIIRSRLAGIPIIFRAETTDRTIKRNLVKVFIRDVSLRLLYRSCFRLLYIGKYSREHFERLGCPSEKLIFSPYCIDAASFDCGEAHRDQLRSEFRASLGIHEAQKVILFSGKLYPRKQPQIILQALKQFSSREREGTTVLFVGDGELRKELEVLAKTEPYLKAIFLGFQNQSQLSRCYHAADLLVLPSLFETWGLVVNEALHHGLPCVVSSAVGCAPDLIEPGVTGEVFAASSVPDLHGVFKRAFLLINSLSVRTQCRNKVSDYSVEKAANGIALAYKALSGKLAD